MDKITKVLTLLMALLLLACSTASVEGAQLDTGSTAITATVPEQGVLTVPGALSFSVENVSGNTTSGSFSVSFTCSLLAGNAARIKVQAMAATFTKPAGAGGQAIPVNKLSWAGQGTPTGGSVSPGNLSDTTATAVFESQPDVTAGSFQLTWTLAAPGTDTAAGDHTLNITWTLESFTPGA